MTHKQRILMCIEREENRRLAHVMKDKPARKRRPAKKIRWDRALPWEN